MTSAMIGKKTSQTLSISNPLSKKIAPASDSKTSPRTFGAIKPHSEFGGATINGL